MSLLAARYVTKPVRAIRAAARTLAHGQLTARAPDTARMSKLGRRDEVQGLVEDFNYMADRLENLVEAHKHLVRDVSHELRSPLARLTLAAELIRQSPSDANEHLSSIEREIKRLDALVERLLLLSRLEAGSQLFSPEWLDMEDVVLQVAEDTHLEAMARPCAVHVLHSEGCPVRGDADLLRSVIENVVRNAIRHTAPNSDISLHLSCTKDSVAQIVVEDCGPGVPDEALKRIFEPFYRADSSRRRTTGGFGLGLAIAQRAVSLHGGTIEAHNRVDRQGLRIEIRIPANSAPVHELEGPRPGACLENGSRSRFLT
jgi:two-component system sensor histidine kinase CpxA